ncbi:MAG: hypothetical protein EBT09_05410 [Actinobacteria bacterium]|nr:hypothetical protein [Actinomycetota bacterium]
MIIIVRVNLFPVRVIKIVFTIYQISFSIYFDIIHFVESVFIYFCYACEINSTSDASRGGLCAVSGAGHRVWRPGAGVPNSRLLSRGAFTGTCLWVWFRDLTGIWLSG